jgi:hypothetical protein
LKNWNTKPTWRRRRWASSLALVCERLPREHDLAVARRVQAGDEVEQRRLAAARRSHDGDELPLADRQVDAAQRPHRCSLRLEGLAQADRLQDQHVDLLTAHETTLNPIRRRGK